MSDQPKMEFLQGQDVVAMLQAVWLDGFVSGVATHAGHGGATDEQAESVADSMSAALQRDPAAMLMIEQEVTERLTGKPAGATKTLKIHGKGES